MAQLLCTVVALGCGSPGRILSTPTRGSIWVIWKLREIFIKKVNIIVKFLGRWQGKGKPRIERVEELWVALYEHQYIEFEDVILLQ